MNLKNITYEYEHYKCIFYQIALGIDYYHREIGKSHYLRELFLKYYHRELDVYPCIVWHDDYFIECRFEQAAINTACYLLAAYDCGMLESRGEGFGCIKAILFDVNNSINELYSLDELKFDWKGTAKSLAALLYMAFGTLSISVSPNGKGEKYSIKSERMTIREDLDKEEEVEEEVKKLSSHSDFLTNLGEYFNVPSLRNSAKQLAPLRDKDSEKDIKLKEVEIMYKIQERAKAYQNELTYLEKIKSALQRIIDKDLECFKQGWQESKLQEIKDYVVENVK